MSESKTEISSSVILITSFDFDGCSDREVSRKALIKHISDASKEIQGLKKNCCYDWLSQAIINA